MPGSAWAPLWRERADEEESLREWEPEATPEPARWDLGLGSEVVEASDGFLVCPGTGVVWLV